MLTLENVDAGYGPTTILHDVSLNVKEGEIVTIVGANGAGKTTTLRTIVGQILPRAGKITFMGEDITKLPAHEVVDRGIILIPEGRQLFPDMTVRENLQMGTYRRAARATQDSRMEEVLELFPRVRERLDQTASSLSGGEQQMLAIARGMMANPKILMFDEPSLGLSPKLIDEYFDTVARIHAQGRTVLLIEQNAEKALSIADRGYLIVRGQIAVEGSRAEMLADDTIRHMYL